MISPHVADPSKPSPTLGLLAAAGPRAAEAPGEYALVIETVREGYLLHYGRPRVIAGADADLALLAGDYLYALGLERLAALGDLEAVRELADLISLSAQLHAEGRRRAREALWLALGDGDRRRRRHPRTSRRKSALREGEPDAPRRCGRRPSRAGRAGGHRRAAGARSRGDRLPAPLGPPPERGRRRRQDQRFRGRRRAPEARSARLLRGRVDDAAARPSPSPARRSAASPARHRPAGGGLRGGADLRQARGALGERRPRPAASPRRPTRQSCSPSSRGSARRARPPPTSARRSPTAVRRDPPYEPTSRSRPAARTSAARCASCGPPDNFICPCHGGVYDFQGKVIGGPPVRPLDRFQTRVRNGQVEIGPRYSVTSQLEPVRARDPGEYTGGIWKSSTRRAPTPSRRREGGSR